METDCSASSARRAVSHRSPAGFDTPGWCLRKTKEWNEPELQQGISDRPVAKETGKEALFSTTMANGTSQNLASVESVLSISASSSLLLDA